jgi:endonuclease/exonuclease/phosphatase (EEP) superfamily protein YafD
MQKIYMPHRNINDLNELQKSLDTFTMENDKNIILAGDFNSLTLNGPT